MRLAACEERHNLTAVRVILLSLGALAGFAANSLLTRGALASHEISPALFALIRIASGAAVLATAASLRPARPADATRASVRWSGAWALVAYLFTFTVAYTRIGAASGALVLFGSVQLSMIAIGLIRGERPGGAGLTGAALALTGLLWLTLPGVAAPDPLGAILMAGAGSSWGVYSIVGRGSRDPIGDTATNFRRATLIAMLPLLPAAWPFAATVRGFTLAICSGTLASGLGYSLWYAALPALSAWRAATMQLLVPIVTAIAAATWLGEPLTARLVGAAACVVGGVLLTLRRLPGRGKNADKL